MLQMPSVLRFERCANVALSLVCALTLAFFATLSTQRKTNQSLDLLSFASPLLDTRKIAALWAVFF